MMYYIVGSNHLHRCVGPCAVCPFMIYGELVQRWRLATGAKLMKWPKEVMEVGTLP